MHLTAFERANMILLCRILGNQEPENKADWERNALILQHGYTPFYDEVFGALYDEILETLYDEINPRVGKLVVAVLNMHRSLLSSFKALRKPDAEKEKRLMFQGFYCNDEADYYLFTKFVLQDMGLFQEFAHTSIDSYGCMVSKYADMLEVFLEITGGQPLKDDMTEEEIERVVEAGVKSKKAANATLEF
jgi:uncharacterized protein YfbU (UPF0304 family)